MSEQPNNNKQLGPTWIGFFLLILILFIPYFLIPMLNSLNTEIQGDKQDKFEAVTLEKETYDTIFRAKRIVESYDENGKLTYKVFFKADNIDCEVECEIPSKYKEQLSKDALYNGTIEVTYVKEFYDNILKSETNNETKYTDIKSAIRYNISGREISNITFMFDNYLITSVKDTETIENDLKSKFLTGYEKESNEDEGK